MEKAELTLKNIYRLITQQDYPMFSSGVLKEQEKKGLTILGFYRDLICYDWKSGHFGSILWEKEGPRKRYASLLINRREDFPYYEGYTREIIKGMTPNDFLSQQEIFRHFLEERHYRKEVFQEKMKYFLEKLPVDDPLCNDEVVSYLNEYLIHTEIPGIFLDSWILTALFLHAVSGPWMKQEPLAAIRQNKEFGVQELYQRMVKETSPGRIKRLTLGGEITKKPLSHMAFFGREQELFDLMEMARRGEKVLLCGIGGIGKTELLRQLCEEALKGNEFDAIAQIQYEGGLKESFARAFLDMSKGSLDEKFQKILYRLTHAKGQNLLLVLDNCVITPGEEEAFKALLEIPGAVILASRQRSLEGFRTYEVPPLSKEASLLVFRSQYQEPLSEKDRKRLSSAITKLELNHPLLLTMLAKSGRYHQWTVEKVVETFASDPRLIQWEQEGTKMSAQQICQDLYQKNTLEEGEKCLLNVLVALPLGQYTEEFLSEVAAKTEPSLSKKKVKNALTKLYKEGWLDLREDGYSIHPVVAEAVLGDGVTEKTLSGLLTYLRAYLPLEDTSGNNFSGNKDALAAKDFLSVVKAPLYPLPQARMAMKAASVMTGTVSLGLLWLCLWAAYSLLAQGEGGEHLRQLLSSLYNRCQESGFEEKTFIRWLGCLQETYDPASVGECIEEGLLRKEPKEKLSKMFLGMLPRLAEMALWQDFAQKAVDEFLASYEDQDIRMLKHFIRWSKAQEEEDVDECIEAFEAMMRCKEESSSFEALRMAYQAYTNMVHLLLARKSHIPKVKALYEEYWEQGFHSEDFDKGILELRMKAAYENYFGESAEAAKDMVRVLDLLEQYFGKRNRTYLICGNDLAFYLNNSGQSAKAAAIYEKLILVGDLTIMNPGYYPMLLNNAGAAYFKEGQLKEAKDRFEKAFLLSRERKIPYLVANVSYWLSRIYREEENLKEEQTYAEKAEAYYKEHPDGNEVKQTYIRERLNILRKGG